MTTPDAQHSIAVCTLADGDYLIGVGALANSLHASGFRGVFWVGYRGTLPAWAASAAQKADYRELQAAADFIVRFVPVADGDTLAIAKPDFALRVLDELAPESPGVMFFDADIVVLGDWSFYQDWMAMGVGLCTERHPFKHRNHPHRKYWQEMVAELNRDTRELDLYFNSGFISVPRQHRDILVCWSQLMGVYRQRVGQPIPGIRHGAKIGPLWATDQEMLNAATMGSDVPLSILGPEGMDFVPLSLYMSHATGLKPWQNPYLRNALLANRPASTDRHFWTFMNQPIAVLPRHVVAWRRACLKLASAIGRFYGR